MKTRRSIAILHIALFLCLGVELAHAKDKTPTPAADAPALTDLQKAQMENFNLKLQMLQDAAAPVLQGRQKLISDIEAQHPGYHFDLRTGNLVANAAPAKGAGAGAAPPADTEPPAEAPPK